MIRLPPDVDVLRDDEAYAAALDELDSLALSEAGTPPARRFDELVRLIEEYDALRNGYLLLPREHRAASAARRATTASRSNAPDFRAPVLRAASARAPRG